MKRRCKSIEEKATGRVQYNGLLNLFVLVQLSQVPTVYLSMEKHRDNETITPGHRVQTIVLDLPHAGTDHRS